MADYTNIPGSLNISIIQGDEMSILCTFNMDLNLYTFAAQVFNAKDNVKTVDITVTNTNLTSGQITLSLTETQTSALTLTDTYKWLLSWVSPGDIKRTILSGNFKVSKSV